MMLASNETAIEVDFDGRLNTVPKETNKLITNSHLFVTIFCL